MQIQIANGDTNKSYEAGYVLGVAGTPLENNKQNIEFFNVGVCGGKHILKAASVIAAEVIDSCAEELGVSTDGVFLLYFKSVIDTIEEGRQMGLWSDNHAL